MALRWASLALIWVSATRSAACCPARRALAARSLACKSVSSSFTKTDGGTGGLTSGVAPGDGLALIVGQGGDLGAQAGGDVDLALGLDDAGRGDELNELAAVHVLGPHGRGRDLPLAEGPERPGHGHGQREQDGDNGDDDEKSFQGV